MGVAMRFCGMNPDTIVLEMSDDARNNLAVLSLGAVERISHLDTYGGITSDVARQVSSTIRTQQSAIKISRDDLSALFRIVSVIDARALNTVYLANISQEKYVSLKQSIMRIYDEVYPSQADT